MSAQIDAVASNIHSRLQSLTQFRDLLVAQRKDAEIEAIILKDGEEVSG